MRKLMCSIVLGAQLASTGCTIPLERVKPALTPVETPEQRIKRIIKDQYVAQEIAKTKFPLILAAIHAREALGYGPLIKGDGGDAVGLFQIQQRWWGKFELDVPSQVKKAEEVLEVLIRRHDADMAVQKWNGKGRDARLYHARATADIKIMQLA